MATSAHVACGVLVDPPARRLAPQPLLCRQGRLHSLREVQGQDLQRRGVRPLRVRPGQGAVPRGGEAGRPVQRVWVGKTSRSDDHLIFDGGEVRKCWTVKRRPEYFRWDRWRVDAVDVHPERPRPPRERAPRDRPRRYITGATSRSMAGHPTAWLGRWTGPATRRSAASASRRSSGRRTRRRRLRRLRLRQLHRRYSRTRRRLRQRASYRYSVGCGSHAG